MTQEELTEKYQKAHHKFVENKSLCDHTVGELQSLIAYECWADGAGFEVALETSRGYQTEASAMRYLEKVFGY